MLKIEPLDTDKILSFYSTFETLPISPRIHLFPELDSTNSYAKKLIQHTQHNPADSTNGSEGTLVLAHRQTAGRGRLGRNFLSETDEGLYISLIINGSRLAEQNFPMQLITPYVAIAVVRTIQSVWNLDVQIKWVNDIFFETKKLGGILTEASFSSQTHASHSSQTHNSQNRSSQNLSPIIIGIGLNIFQEQKNFPKEIQDIASSVYEALKKQTSKQKFSEKQNTGVISEHFFASKNFFTAQLIHNVFKIFTQDIHKISEHIDEYKHYSNVLGKDILVVQKNKTFPAKAIDINQNGHLLVEDSDGIRHVLVSGEVSLRFLDQN